MQVEDPETAVARIIELVKTRIPKRFGLDPIRDIQVLCPMNRGGAGARSLNIELQAALNPGWEITDPSKQRVTPDPYHAGEFLVEQLPTGEWIERAPYFEAVAVNGDGVFETLRGVSKLVLKSLA